MCAPVPACPSWSQALAAERVALHVHVVDRVSPACTAPTAVSVSLDGQLVAAGELPCRTDVLRAPAESLDLDGPEVVAGLHELTVRVRLEGGAVEASTLMSLPAFDLSEDGRSMMVGAEIPVEVEKDDVTIGPPQVYAPKAL